MAGGVYDVERAKSIDGVLAKMDVEDVWGIGRNWAIKLRQDGISTALDLKRSDSAAMRKRYNVVMQRLVAELNGESCLEMEEIAPKKEIIASRSFGERVTDKQSLLEAVSLHATRAGEKLRRQHSACGCLIVSIRTGRHNPNDPYYGQSASVQFPTATSDTGKLIAAARAGVERIYRPGFRYAKAGVALIDVMPNNAVQQNLFAQGDSPKSALLMQTLDNLNKQYGKHTLRFAAEGTDKTWDMKRDLRTKSYTTDWRELPVARAE